MSSAAPPPHQQERWAWEEQCDTLLCEAIAALGRYNGSLDAAVWAPLATRGPLAVSRHVSDPGSSTRLAGTGYIHGRLEDITRGLYCDNDADLVGNEAVLSGEPVLDGAVLQALERRGKETPFRFAGVKWVATQCGSVQRDLLTYERMGMTLDSDNTEVAYHIVYSIPDHADWPTPAQLRALSSMYRERTAPVDIKRLEPFAMCYLYRKVSEDLVLCFILGEYWGAASGNVQREAEHVLAQRVLMVSNALACCEAKILTKMLHHCKDTPVQMTKTCLRCRATRGTVTDPLRLCGICRKSVCRACCSLKATCRIDPHSKLAVPEVFCTKCLVRASISTTPSGEHKTGLRNADNDVREQREHRQRRDQHHQKNHHQRHHQNHHDRRHVVSEARARNHHHTSREPRILQADFIPAHAYNYDGLIRNRANSGGSSSSTTSLHTVRDEHGRSPTDRQDRDGGVTMRMTEPSVGAASHRSRDDLYLRGSFLNGSSSEAERRYQRHLEREKSFNEGHEVQQRASEPHSTQRHHTVRQPPPPHLPSSRVHAGRHSFERREGTRLPVALSVHSPSTMQNQTTVREFYRDLYTEL